MPSSPRAELRNANKPLTLGTDRWRTPSSALPSRAIIQKADIAALTAEVREVPILLQKSVASEGPVSGWA